RLVRRALERARHAAGTAGAGQVQASDPPAGAPVPASEPEGGQAALRIPADPARGPDQCLKRRVRLSGSAGMSVFRACAVVPVYNHHVGLAAVVTALRDQDLPVILVDDGSDAVTRDTLAAQARRSGVEC